MQINMINFSKIGSNQTGTSKGEVSGAFGDVLNELKEKGSPDIMQLLAAGGFIMPQSGQQMAQGEQGKNGQSQSDTSEDTAKGDLSVSPTSISSLAMQGLFAQGIMMQSMTPQSIVGQGSVAQITAPQSIVGQGSAAQITALQSIVGQGNVAQIMTPQSNIGQGNVTQIITPQSNIGQGNVTQITTPQNIVGQGNVAQIMTPQSNIGQGNVTQITTPQSITQQGSVAQITTPQNVTQQGSVAQITTPQSITQQGSVAQITTPQSITQQGSVAQITTPQSNIGQGNVAQNMTPMAQVTSQNVTFGGITNNFSSTLNASTEVDSSAATAGQPNISQSVQSNVVANESQQVAVPTQGNQTEVSPHMIYGTRMFSNSFSPLASNQTTQVSGQQSQTTTSQGDVSSAGVSSTNIPLVQQGNVQAVQTTALQSADLSPVGKSLKVDGDATQISGIQATQGSSSIGAKGAAAAQSGSKDTNTGTDSGSKHSSDSGTSQSIFGAIQASAIDTKNTPVVTQEQKTAVANQLASAVKQADENGRSQISLHLSPEDLGGINIKIVSQGGTLSLQITADNSHTGQLIASGMHELTQAMHDAGISMNKADVLFDSNGGSGTSTGSGQQASPQQQGGDTSYKTPKWMSAMQNSSVVSSTADNQVSDNGTMSILA